MFCGKNKRRTKGKTTQMLYDNLRGVFGFARRGREQGFLIEHSPAFVYVH